VDADHGAEDGAVADAGVARGHRAIGEDDVVADGGVVADVGPGQQHVVVADRRHAAAERRAAVQGDVFADAVVVADAQLAR